MIDYLISGHRAYASTDAFVGTLASAHRCTGPTQAGVCTEFINETEPPPRQYDQKYDQMPRTTIEKVGEKHTKSWRATSILPTFGRLCKPEVVGSIPISSITQFLR